MNNSAKLYRNRSWMLEHYVTKEESTPTMGRAAGCSDETIRRWLHELGISVRDHSESLFLATRNFVIITPELLELLEGELLGDGCVSMRKNRSACYQHSSKYKEYLVWLSGQFADLGLKQIGGIYKYPSKRGAAFHYSTSAYPELVPIRQRWYPNGKKIVPKDLKLTPAMAKHWHLGDGSLRHPRDCRPYITFATNGFNIGSINYLIKELQKQGFKATCRPSDNTIGLSVHSTQDFLSWIGPCPVSCYAYKWNYAGSVTQRA